jgi:hypothetical protein
MLQSDTPFGVTPPYRYQVVMRRALLRRSGPGISFSDPVWHGSPSGGMKLRCFIFDFHRFGKKKATIENPFSIMAFIFGPHGPFRAKPMLGVALLLVHLACVRFRPLGRVRQDHHWPLSNPLGLDLILSPLGDFLGCP